MRNLFTTSLLLGAVGLAAGCDSVSVSDSMDIDFDFISLSGPSDDLHSPYVKGVSMKLYIDTTGDDNLTRWYVVSSDPAVFRIDEHTGDHSRLTVSATAVGDGIATLTIHEGGGGERARREVESRTPELVQLSAYGPILIKRAEQAPVDELRILQGGVATYLVTYWHQGRQLSGHGVLTAEAPADVTAEPRTTFLFEDREWLTVTAPLTAGESTVDLYVGGVAATSIALQTVPPSDVIRIAIQGEDEAEAENGDLLVALAQAYDGENRRVYGVEYEWAVDGLVELDAGDLYRYEFIPQATQSLDAKFGDMTASATIHAGEGVVDSTNNIGCAAAPGRSTPAALGLVLLAGLALVRRRRA